MLDEHHLFEHGIEPNRCKWLVAFKRCGYAKPVIPSSKTQLWARKDGNVFI